MVAPGAVEVATWPLEGVGRPDLLAVDVLARLQLAARRLGFAIQVREPSAELRALLDLTGLLEVLQVLGEPESGEQAGVEEEVEPDDPVA